MIPKTNKANAKDIKRRNGNKNAKRTKKIRSRVKKFSNNKERSRVKNAIMKDVRESGPDRKKKTRKKKTPHSSPSRKRGLEGNKNESPSKRQRFTLLAPGWEEHQTDTGVIYYWNRDADECWSLSAFHNSATIIQKQWKKSARRKRKKLFKLRKMIEELEVSLGMRSEYKFLERINIAQARMIRRRENTIQMQNRTIQRLNETIRAYIEKSPLPPPFDDKENISPEMIFELSASGC
jgi:hypothetical protein